MNAWIIYYRDKAEYNRNYIDIYKEEGKKLGIDFSLVLIEDLDFGVKDGNLYLIHKNITYWERDEKFPDFLVFRAIYPLLSKHLELMGMKVYNNSFVADICNDKAKTYQYLARTGIPMVDACMRSLQHTGYLNFRMRAMLVSFLCHHLEVDWRYGTQHLADRKSVV